MGRFQEERGSRSRKERREMINVINNLGKTGGPDHWKGSRYLWSKAEGNGIRAVWKAPAWEERGEVWGPTREARRKGDWWPHRAFSGRSKRVVK